ncbi:putative tRNA-dihydrouridine(20) synthase (NAD(P)(+)) [Rosa chinensis]|uniref:Putative tRNA-dihydrouridine(20) synthase (NAD(P)(+)) n=1 Tax=Rosa chinensis TaxID=74649 RepID=A0A2P6PCN0_ROSCH|nr:putative tRNA-dihydrouridine(20) synthase (NAD(P)(+)) [Rosa chinensis]
MGCLRSFSVSGGMGAASLSKPDLIHDDTVELARRIEKTGVSALAVHGRNDDHMNFWSINYRRVADKLRDPAKWSEIADIVASLSIPVIANGASSIMAARGALWNASIFSPKGKLPWEDVKKEYSILWDNDIKSTKHTLKEMIMYYSSLELPEGKAVIKSESLEDLA